MASEATHRAVEAAKGRLSHKARLEAMAGALEALLWPAMMSLKLVGGHLMWQGTVLSQNDCGIRKV